MFTESKTNAIAAKYNLIAEHIIAELLHVSKNIVNENYVLTEKTTDELNKKVENALAIADDALAKANASKNTTIKAIILKPIAMILFTVLLILLPMGLLPNIVQWIIRIVLYFKLFTHTMQLSYNVYLGGKLKDKIAELKRRIDDYKISKMPDSAEHIMKLENAIKELEMTNEHVAQRMYKYK